jgi:dihydrolipoamide dehydrogenase
VIGAGVIGLELGSVWARLGAKVTLLDAMPRLLPNEDEELARLAHKLFARQGLDFRLGVKVESVTPSGRTAKVRYTSEDGGIHELDADRVLVAVGRRANTQGLGAETVGLVLERGRIVVDDAYRTAVPGIWAIGDVIRGPMLAHKAEEEGIAAVETMAGMPGHVNMNAIPSIIYTQPEIASIGKTTAQLDAEGAPYRVGRFPFSANARAKALGQTDGFVKLIACARTDRLLGAHIIGPRASELAAELALAIEFSASAEDVARSVHAHPTLAEVVKEAALSVDGRPIHI